MMALVSPPSFLKLLAHELRWRLVEALARSDRRVQDLVALVGEPHNLVVTRVQPLAIAAMAEKQIEISGQRSKHLAEILGQDFDYIVTVCDNAREACPVFPGAPEQIHWSIPDPSVAEGDEAPRLCAFRVASDELMTRIRYLLVQIDRKRS